MFIKLTDHKNGRPIYVNSEYVGLVYYRRSQDGDLTVVELVGLGTAIVKVNESVEEVVDLLMGNVNIQTDYADFDPNWLGKILTEKSKRKKE